LKIALSNKRKATGTEATRDSGAGHVVHLIKTECSFDVDRFSVSKMNAHQAYHLADTDTATRNSQLGSSQFDIDLCGGHNENERPTLKQVPAGVVWEALSRAGHTPR